MGIVAVNVLWSSIKAIGILKKVLIMYMSMPSSSFSVFLQRLLIGWSLSGIVVAINAYDAGIDFIFSDATVAFFALGTGPLIAGLSSWHYFSSGPHRNLSMTLTAACTVAASMIVLFVDVNHREELDGLITIFAILPQLFILDFCIITFAIHDRKIAHS